MKIKKIHITGPYGSGKTTLGEKISEKLKIPFYSFDDIKYLVKWTKKRPTKEIINEVKKISKQRKWVTEGNLTDYAESIFKNADLIIILKPKKLTSKLRILKRYLFRQKQENDTLKGATKLIRKINKYYKGKEHPSLYSHQKLIKKYNKKFVILKNKKQINNFVKSLK